MTPVPQGFVISLNSLITLCWIAHHGLLTWRPTLTTSRCWLLLPAISIQEAEEKANLPCTTLVRWADGMQLAIAPQKSSMNRLTSNTHLSWLHSQVRIGIRGGPAEQNAKNADRALRWTVDTQFTFGPHTRDCIERASRALNVIKALADMTWGFMTETLVVTKL